MRLFKIAIILVPAMVLPGLAACASAFPPDGTEMLMPTQAALVQTTCADVMHLKSWQQEFSGCVASLSQTMTYQVRSSVLRQSYADCLAAGLKRGTPTYADCVLDRRDAHEAGLRRQASETPVLPTPIALSGTAGIHNAAGSFFDDGFAGQRRKEEHACAALNIEPGSAPFGQCVTDLDTTIFDIEHPLG